VNHIFMQNMNSVMNAKKVLSKSEAKLLPTSYAAQFVLHLLENGPTTASDINNHFKYPTSVCGALGHLVDKKLLVRTKPAGLRRGFMYEVAPNVTLESC
jgi:predicted transcriptional regulator